MSVLLDAIKSSLGSDAGCDECRYTASMLFCSVPRERFVDAAKAMRKVHALLVAEWAADETPFNRGFGIYACYRWGAEYLIVKTEAPFEDPAFPTLTKQFLPAYRFERQIKSLMGVTAAGHPDSRPWIKFEDWPEDAWPLRKSFDASKPMPRVAGEYKFLSAEGEGVYEIPVGPVHAGIIEPGHFRFQAVGEDILNLEERLGYVHKGIEKKFESLSWKDGSRLAGRVSGDTTAAHSLGYCMALESMTGCKVPERAQWLRALFLERERIANHLGDLGAICNDAAFAFMLYQMSRLREIMLRTNHELFGHRFMMDRIIPGGIAVDIEADGKELILSELKQIAKEFNRLVKIYDQNSSLEDRVRDTGILIPDKARRLCQVGIVARASGLNLDCRTQNPFPPYDRIKVNVPVLISGDVHARAWVRVEEVRESIRIIREILNTLPSGAISSDVGLPSPDTYGFSAVEGWRGEIVYWLQSGPKGEVNRCMVRDPSSVNWLGLEQAVLGNIVPDFPLCNKSFNQSYSGNDL
ncbi:MAG: NADH-quinone oxidoreductase subunit C [Thermodesulfovibrionia bacterium]|nr:NADH-quinone oxidoreductase subunit C [Thermodesulfovibrionia bacterium]